MTVSARSSDGTSPAHFLLAGDRTDIDLLAHLLRKLPIDAYGQVFIEIESPDDAVQLAMPAGMTLTWLVGGGSRSGYDRGERAAQALVGWVSEWMPETRDAHTHPYVMWVGCSTSTVMDRLYDRLGDRLDQLHLHQRERD